MGLEILSAYISDLLCVMEYLILGIVCLYQGSIFYIICKDSEKKVCQEAHGQTGVWVKLE
jgi:hypothetical protein